MNKALKTLNIFVLSTAVLTFAACSDGGSDTAPSATTPTPTPSSNSAPAAVQAAAADPMARGAKLYKRCQSCHSLEQGGRNKVGPNLWGIYGATAGQVEGFKYSAAMAKSGIVWTEETMDGYLENPRKYLPGGKMAFAGLRKAEDRAAIQIYLKAQTGAN